MHRSDRDWTSAPRTLGADERVDFGVGTDSEGVSQTELAAFFSSVNSVWRRRLRNTAGSSALQVYGTLTRTPGGGSDRTALKQHPYTRAVWWYVLQICKILCFSKLSQCFRRVCALRITGSCLFAFTVFSSTDTLTWEAKMTSDIKFLFKTRTNKHFNSKGKQHNFFLVLSKNLRRKKLYWQKYFAILY